MFSDLWNPLLLDVLVGGVVTHAVADQEHVSQGVGQRSQLIKVFLTCRVKQSNLQR